MGRHLLTVTPHDLAEEPAFVDAAGVAHEPAREATRIVSLVPSLTELLCDLGLAGDLFGRTAEMTSWYGSQAIAGLRYLARFRRGIAGRMQ